MADISYEIAAQYVIDNDLYGRFDLSGGIDGKPIKLIEFNADTPTLLFEKTVIQYMLLQYNQLRDAIASIVTGMRSSCFCIR